MSEFLVSARKYRPTTFDDVVGQTSVTSTLKNAIQSNQLAQSYLFCGPRGVGKTTCARIFAKEINLFQNTDQIDDLSYNIFELDAASNNSVKLSNESHKQDNLEFLVGDSENIPFENNYFDLVINVESSHCYPSIPKFINEVSRVLKKNGKFLYCDFVIDTNITDHLSKLEHSELISNDYIDITKNIIKASDIMTQQRKELLKSVKSNFLKRILESFAAIKGSKIYNSFVDGHYKYISLIKTKK